MQSKALKVPDHRRLIPASARPIVRELVEGAGAIPPRTMLVNMPGKGLGTIRVYKDKNGKLWYTTSDGPSIELTEGLVETL